MRSMKKDFPTPKMRTVPVRISGLLALHFADFLLPVAPETGLADQSRKPDNYISCLEGGLVMITPQRHEVRLHGHRIGFVKPLFDGRVEVFALNCSGDHEYIGKAASALDGRAYLEGLCQALLRLNLDPNTRGKRGRA